MDCYRSKITFFLLSLGLICCAYAENTTNDIPGEILDQYVAAASGNSEATEKAYAALTQLHVHKPDSALVLTVLGSAETMMARDSFVPWRQLQYLEKGMAKMDKGISLLQARDAVTNFQGLPITLWVKNTAGCTYVELPNMFNRTEAGYTLLVEALENKEVASLPFTKLVSTYLCAGKAAKSLDNLNGARKYLEPIVEKMPDSEEAKQATELLKDIKRSLIVLQCNLSCYRFRYY